MIINLIVYNYNAMIIKVLCLQNISTLKIKLTNLLF